MVIGRTFTLRGRRRELVSISVIRKHRLTNTRTYEESTRRPYIETEAIKVFIILCTRNLPQDLNHNRSTTRIRLRHRRPSPQRISSHLLLRRLSQLSPPVSLHHPYRPTLRRTLYSPLSPTLLLNRCNPHIIPTSLRFHLFEHNKLPSPPP